MTNAEERLVDEVMLATTRNFDETLERITKDLFVKELYMKREDQIDDDDFQKWIDYGLGTPVFATGFGQAWYKMVERTVMVNDEVKAYELNKSVSSWCRRAFALVKSLMRV